MADAREAVEVQPGDEFICKECGKPLQVVQEGVSGGSRKKLLLMAVAVVAIAGAVATWTFWPRNRYPEEPRVAEKTGVVPRQPGEPQTQTAATTPCGLKAVNPPDLNRLLTYLKQGMNYASQNRYDLALNEFEQVQQIDPNFLAMHENIAAAQLKLKKTADAEAHLQEELKLIGCLDQMNDTDLPAFAYMLEVSQAGASDPNVARAQAMRTRLKQARAVAHYNLACIRSMQGAAEQAAAELRQAVESGFSDIAALKRDPDLARVRSSPAFQGILAAASAPRGTAPTQ